MRKFFLFLALFAGIAIAGAQTYKVDKGGNVVVVQGADSSAVKVERIYSVVNGTTFYIGARGGIYYYRVSAKTGKRYRVYLKVKED